MELLLSSFLESYGPLIILLVCFVAYMAYVVIKNKKDRDTIGGFQQSLKAGDKVVTTSGIYGTIVAITDTTDGRVVTLQISENATIDINMDAIYNVDAKTEVKEEPAVATSQTDELVEEGKAEVAEKLEAAEQAEGAELEQADAEQAEAEVVEAEVAEQRAEEDATNAEEAAEVEPKKAEKKPRKNRK